MTGSALHVILSSGISTVIRHFRF